MQLYAAVLVARNFKIQEPLFVENFLFYDPVKDGQKRFRDKGAKSLLLWVLSHKTVLIYPWMRNPCEFTNAYRSCLVILLQRRQLNINMSFRGQIFNAQYCAYCFFLLIFSHTHCIYCFSPNSIFSRVSQKFKVQEESHLTLSPSGEFIIKLNLWTQKKLFVSKLWLGRHKLNVSSQKGEKSKKKGIAGLK